MKPSRGEWLRYAYGARLPAHVPWVKHDLLDAGWRLRLVGRVLVQLVPVLVVCAVVPLPFVDRFFLLLLVLLAALMTAATAAEQLRDRRLKQHGLPIPVDADELYRRNRHY